MVEVRVAAGEEIAAAGDVVRSAYEVDGLATLEYREVIADARLRAAEADLLVAVSNGQVLGTVTFALAGSPWAQVAAPGEAEFRVLGVAAAARGRGIGEALVRACLDRARAASATAVVLSTEGGMVAAHRLYERLGFTRRAHLDWSPVPGVQLRCYGLALR